MAKAVKKRRRLKRSVRKTLGALFLASAIAVGAIPTEGLQAAPDVEDPSNGGDSVYIGGYTREEGEAKTGIFAPGMVPYVDPNAHVYSYPIEGKGVTFRFAYVSPETGSEISADRYAVIVGYSQRGDLTGGELEIPQYMEAYRSYSQSASDAGNVAVNMGGEFLFYYRKEPVLDAAGNPTYERWTPASPSDYRDNEGFLLDGPVDQGGLRVPVTVDRYYPCYYDKHSEWANDDMFYVQSGSTVSGGNTVPTYRESPATDRISAAKVLYIGSQYVTETATGEFHIAGVVDSVEHGIFNGATNITNLKVSNDIEGIGNYAFAGSGFQSITFGNGLKCIGDHAFEGCTSLREVKFDYSCGVNKLGAYCFSRCTALTTVDLPGHVRQVGNCAFENCTRLQHVNFIHDGFDGELTKLGQTVFKNCSELVSLEFPVSYVDPVDVSQFQGCESLFFIKTNNSEFTLDEGDLSSFGFSSVTNPSGDITSLGFIDTVLPTFYLEGPQVAALHELARDKEIAYRFHHRDWDMDIYEKAVYEYDDEIHHNENYRSIYWVNTDGRIVNCEMGREIESLVLPETIGPQQIVGIDNGTFQDKCKLKSITIPASVQYIAGNSFKGSHSLVNVIFTDAESVKEIGQGAFNTQATDNHAGNCPNGGATPSADCYLNFVGTIGYDIRPFEYAMNPSEYINTGSQYRTYITYYSGWPTNLAVRYNETTDLNELIGYPTFADLADYGEDYLYMTPEYIAAAREAALKYTSGLSLTQNERTIVDATLKIVLPDGIESIAYVDEAGNPVPDALVYNAKRGLYEINERYITTVSGGDGAGSSESRVKSLFSYNEDDDNLTYANGSHLMKSVTARTLQLIGPEAFKDCVTLKEVDISGSLESIGDHAFWGCEYLSDVSISEYAREVGLRPFAGCESLSTVEFNGSDYLSCENSLIFKLGSDGKTLVEYLCARGVPDVVDEELIGVKELYPEAFMGTRVENVDMTMSSIAAIPKNAFSQTVELYNVKFPDTCRSISIDSFSDSNVRRLYIPASVGYVDPDMCGDHLDGIYAGMTDLSKLVIYTTEDSAACIWAGLKNVRCEHQIIPDVHTVTFYDDAEFIGDPEHKIADVDVEDGYSGDSAFRKEGYDYPTKDGYIFDSWWPSVDGVTRDMDTGARYKEIDTTITVTFWDRDWEDPTGLSDVIYRVDEKVPYGGYVAIPLSPSHEGYTFIGWKNAIADEDKPGYFGPFTKDTDIYAQYVEGNSGSGSGSGDDGNGGGTGDDGNGGGTGGDGSGGGGTGGDGSGGGGTGTNVAFYTLTVENGSGSGSYVAGSQPIIIANDPAAKQEFSHWTIDPEDTTIASKKLPATIITMPTNNVTVTAHYQAKTGSSSGGGSSSSANSGRPNNGSGTVGGTTVVIDKNGLSNTGVVSATVNGSSDNFVIKITDSSAATEAVIRALMAEYGSLDNIKYFPMDISLYDSTGTKKITDTTGLSISITLPLPDSLITYAGNNKVAGVVNDKLDKLTPKFTTIQGVSCVTFTAEHFSPYVIYVDTAHLTAGTSSDSTPKTGDGIHPKWFLSIGLACLSFVMFMQKDKRKTQKVKVKVKAKA